LLLGVISDTHGLLRPEALDALRGSDHILHVGDIGSQDIIPALEKIAPVSAIRGNIDVEPWCRKFPVTRTLEFGGFKFHLIHNRAELKPNKMAQDIACTIFGHSHQSLIETKDGILYFNPGSAGPRRFKLPISVGHIRIENDELHPEIIPL
jgi:uncharacterized protein